MKKNVATGRRSATRLQRVMKENCDVLKFKNAEFDEGE